MLRKFLLISFIASSGVLFSACGLMTPVPQKTPLELQAMQSKEFNTSKKVAFASTVTVFQDLGYIINSADFDTGFISASSPTKGGSLFIFGSRQTNTKATAFIEEMRAGNSKIRLNFVESTKTSTAEGQLGGYDKPVEDGIFYRNAFTRIQEAIFIRKG